MPAIENESGFMASLFADLDASIFSEGPSPTSTFKRSSSQSQSSQRKKDFQSCTPSNFPRTPSPHKRAVKRIKRDVECSISSSSNDNNNNHNNHNRNNRNSTSQSRRMVEQAEEVRTATDIFLQVEDEWKNDILSPPSAKKKPSTIVQKRGVDFADSPKKIGKRLDKNWQEQYSRCIVKEVSESSYIPAKYQSAPPGRFTTKGVQHSTVKAAMQKKQKIIYLADLNKIELSTSQEKHNGKQKEGQRRKAILRDEWLSTFVQQGDVVHLIGKWEQRMDEEYECRIGESKRIEIELDDPDRGLWDELDDFPLSSVSSSNCGAIGKTMIPTMILASSRQEDRREGLALDNLLILHPDLLLSATAVSTVIRCTRKSYLQSTIKASGPASEDAPSESLLLGKMLHEVLQSCLTGRSKRSKLHKETKISTKEEKEEKGSDSPFPAIWQGPDSTDFSSRFVKDQIECQIENSLEEILAAKLNTETAKSKLWEAAAPFGKFALRYLLSDKDGGPRKDAEAADVRASSPAFVQVKRILDVEEDIWSPKYGLKGFVDVSVEVEITKQDGEKKKEQPKRYIMPLELKTGRSTDMVQHQAQTMLYTLLMSDRYGQSIDMGLLYYSKSSTLHLIQSAQNEIRALLMARNELADYLSRRAGSEKPILPSTIDSERDCGRCYVADECMLYRRAVEKVDVDTDESSIASIYKAKVQHLSQEHADFFQHWDRLLTLEENDVVRFRRELWTMTASAREAMGRCLADMKMVEEAETSKLKAVSSHNGMNEQILFHFQKRSSGALLVGNLAIGDPITVSIEPAMYSVAQGHIFNLTPSTVTVAVDRNLKSLMKRNNKAQRPVFRIDKEEFANGLAKVRYNLAKLFFAGPHGDVRRRGLIVDLREPQYKKEKKEKVDTTIDKEDDDLNEDQRQAIQKVLSAKDYALVVGMPGTGKTSTIVQLIKQLTQRGNSILLTSYTHSAVDTICRKLVGEEAIELLRLGKDQLVHSDVQANTLKASLSVEDLQDQLMKPNVVATTCLSISHALFAKRTFDYCIVDEASQITLPTCLGPLRYADKFVLVGDSLQLPPLVKNSRAKEGGLDISLFDLLQKAHPQSVAQLRVQYRMNEDIMTLSNQLIYQGQLQCGNEAVRTSWLHLNNLNEARLQMHSSGSSQCSSSSSSSSSTATITTSCWIERILDKETRALFIDTDRLTGAEEKRVGETLLENEVEVEIVSQLSAAFACAGVGLNAMAIITPYRQQIRAFMRKLGNAAAGDDKIEILTADKSQGRDKDVIFISLVRSLGGHDKESGIKSKEEGGIGQLLNDVKRINVALTRAKKKLIIVGSRGTLSQSELLKKLWNLMQDKGWTMALSDEQLQQHQGPLGAMWRMARKPPSSSSSSSSSQPTQKMTKSQAILRTRPILQDVLNEVM